MSYSVIRLLVQALSRVSLAVTVLAAPGLSMAQSVRVTSLWIHSAKSEERCFYAAVRTMQQVGYKGLTNTETSVYAGTDNLTAVIRCDMPGRVILIIAYQITPPTPESNKNIERLKSVFQSLL